MCWSNMMCLNACFVSSPNLRFIEFELIDCKRKQEGQVCSALLGALIFINIRA